MSNGNEKKLKLLLFGAVGDKISVLVNKIKALHKSKAGPFDVCFCVGGFRVPAEGSADYDLLQALPIPVYVQDAIQASTSISSDESNEEIQTLIEPNLKAFPANRANIFNISLPDHPHINIVVASCPGHLRMDASDTVKPLMDKLSHVSFVGCDLLLTSHWPQGMENLDTNIGQQAQLCSTYDVAEVALRARARYHICPAHASLNQYWQSPPFLHLAATTSTKTPQHTGRLVALGHLSQEKKVPKENKFVHALGLVPLHHMDVQELQQSLGQGVSPCPFTDESYRKDNARNGSHENFISNVNAGGLSEAQARRILAEGNAPPNQQRWNLPNNNRKRKKAPEEDDQEQEVDPTNSTLFIHGLHKDVSGQLQRASDISLLQAFQPHGCTKVRHPPNAATSSFAFLEFESHEQAKMCLETLGGETSVNGVNLTLKWATHGNKNKNAHAKKDTKRQRLTEEEAKDSSTLYYRLPTRILSNDYASKSEKARKWMEHTLEDALSEEGSPRITAAEEPALRVELRYTEPHPYGFLDFASHAAASMAIATLTGSTNGGLVLCPDGGEEEGTIDDTKDAGNSESVKKDEDSAKPDDTKVDGNGESVKKEEDSAKPDDTKDEGNGESAKKEEDSAKPDGTKDEGNSESAKKEEDSTKPEEKEEPGKKDEKSKDDTTVKKESGSETKLEKIWGLALHWAHARIEKSDKTQKDIVQDADCNFQFKRQHFPPDSRHDCWFCLASEGCEKHLITGVYSQCYAAMPKGPIHKGHVLLIPVAHSSQGAFLDKTVSSEIRELQQALRKHASEEYGMDLFVFERAIQTKGGYHTHVQCVPVPKGLGVKLETNLRAQAKANHIELREIQNPELVMSSLFNQDDDEDEGGYFYCEVPLPGAKLEFKRFLYKVKSDTGGDGRRRQFVPLQFGREIVAATMGKQELAHWKSCQVDKEEEAKMARELRDSFEKYYAVEE